MYMTVTLISSNYKHFLSRIFDVAFEPSTYLQISHNDPFVILMTIRPCFIEICVTIMNDVSGYFPKLKEKSFHDSKSISVENNRNSYCVIDESRPLLCTN